MKHCAVLLCAALPLCAAAMPDRAFGSTFTVDLTGTEADGTAVDFHIVLAPEAQTTYTRNVDGFLYEQLLSIPASADPYAGAYIQIGNTVTPFSFEVGAFLGIAGFGDYLNEDGFLTGDRPHFGPSDVSWFFDNQIHFYVPGGVVLAGKQDDFYAPGEYDGTGVFEQNTGATHLDLGDQTITFTHISVVDPPDSVASDVPEPSVWALMLAGFGLIGFTVRARKLSRASHHPFAA